jgi:hypothetical protein
VLVLNDVDANYDFYKQLVLAVEEKGRPIASVILGLTHEYALLDDLDKISELHQSFQSAIETSVTKSHQLKMEARKSTEYQLLLFKHSKETDKKDSPKDNPQCLIM